MGERHLKDSATTEGEFVSRRKAFNNFLLQIGVLMNCKTLSKAALILSCVCTNAIAKPVENTDVSENSFDDFIKRIVEITVAFVGPDIPDTEQVPPSE